MRRIGIVDYVMSAGGLERVLRAVAGALLEIPEARDWDVTLLLSRYSTTNQRVEWPAALTGPQLHVEWLGEASLPGRVLDSWAHGQGFWGLPYTKNAARGIARALRGSGPRTWRVWAGDPMSSISRASERFDLLCFTYPLGVPPPPLRTRVVTTPQDFNFKFFLAEESPERRATEEAVRGWLDRSDRILLSSQAMYDEMARFYPEMLGKAGIVRLGLSSASEPTPDELTTFRTRLGLPERFLLVPGWVMAHKNQLAVVEAASRLRAQGLHIPVVFVGPNSAQLHTEDVGSRGHYVERVRFALREAGFLHGRDYWALGYVSDREVQLLYRLATLCVVPSYYEGFGLPSLEAMRARCPTVLSAIAPLKEQHAALGGLGRLFDPADAADLASQIAWVLRHPADAAEEARAAAERVAEVYDWKKTVRGYLAAFQEVIDARRDPAPAPPRPSASPSRAS
jgi:glycosyltransferase involved in cell wall biosynthesis